MTDLEINIALAQAMGWVEIDHANTNAKEPNFEVTGDTVECWDPSCMSWRKFDYRDPVIFTAICKHWNLVANFGGVFASGTAGTEVVGHWGGDCIEKAAALTVIELAKRGVK